MPERRAAVIVEFFEIVHDGMERVRRTGGADLANHNAERVLIGELRRILAKSAFAVSTSMATKSMASLLLEKPLAHLYHEHR